jgi:hypothetical protein
VREAVSSFRDRFAEDNFVGRRNATRRIATVFSQCDKTRQKATDGRKRQQGEEVEAAKTPVVEHKGAGCA